MSDTLGNVRNRIRYLLNDLDHGNFAIATFRLDHWINDGIMRLSTRVGTPAERTVPVVTLVIGTIDYTLGGTNQYQSVTEVVLASTFRPLVKISEVQMAQERTSQRRGLPQMYCLSEASDQTARLRIDAAPYATDLPDSLQLKYSILPARVAADADLILLMNPMLRALEKLVAAEVLIALPPEALQRLGVNPAIAPLWLREVDGEVSRERVRKNRLRRIGNIERVEA